MSGRLTSILLSAFVAAVMAVMALAVHDAFYGAMRVSPSDVGLQLGELFARTAIYSLVVLIPALVGAGLALWALGRLADRLLAKVGVTSPNDEDRFVYKRDLAAAAIISFLLLIDLPAVSVLDLPSAVGVVAPDFWEFAGEKPSRIAAVFVAMFVPLAALAGWGRKHGGLTENVTPAELAVIGLIVAIPAGCAITLAAQWGTHLGEQAARGATVTSAQFDPFHLHAEPVCVTPSAGAAQVRELGGSYMYLGQNAGNLVLFDRDLPGAVRRSSATASVHHVGSSSIAEVICAVRAPRPEAATGADPTVDHAIARQYRPWLRFDRREPWRPLEIEAFFAESHPGGGTHQVCAPDCSAIASSLELRGDASARLDVHGESPQGRDYLTPIQSCRSGVLKDCDARGTSAIYYRVTRAFDRVFVDYWWFFRYNHFPVTGSGICGGRGKDLGNHEGDWEGVTAVTKPGRPDRLDWLGYSSHGHLIRYLKQRPAMEDGRPVVYVACGSHAAYPAKCSERCRQTQQGCRTEPCVTTLSPLAEATFDGAAPWGRNSDEACERGSLCLRPLPSVRELPEAIRKGGATAFTSWPGVWGTRGDPGSRGVADGPRSPARQARFKRPWEPVASNRTRFGAAQVPGAAPTQPGDVR